MPASKTRGALRRPIPYHFDKNEFERMCAFQSTWEEMALWFRCDSTTLQAWVRREYGVESHHEIRDKHLSEGKISLRRRMFQRALSEDPKESSERVLLHLAKHHLGQVDTSINVTTDVQALSNDELKRLLPKALNHLGLNAGEVVEADDPLDDAG